MPTMRSTPEEREVREFLTFAIGEAHRDADAVVRVLQALHDAKPDTELAIPLERSEFLKLAAYLRIEGWERSELRRHIDWPLPPACDVLRDLTRDASTPERFDGRLLSFAVVCASWNCKAWNAFPGSGAEVVVRQHLSPELVAEALASILWQFRHLAK